MGVLFDSHRPLQILKKLRPYLISERCLRNTDSTGGSKENFELIRRRGYALDHEELERGLSGVAAPVFFQENHLVATVGIAGPAGRFLG